MKPDRKCAEIAIVQIYPQQPSHSRPRFRRAAVSRACVGSVIRESRSVQTFSDPHSVVVPNPLQPDVTFKPSKQSGKVQDVHDRQ